MIADEGPAPFQGRPAAAPQRRRGLLLSIGAWLVLSAALLGLAAPNASVPGLNYDEAIFGAMAKDFVRGEPRGVHLPGHQIVDVQGRPFPVYVQDYLGALKCWMLIPVFAVLEPGVSTLRFATLAWSLVALLLFMLWIRRVVGAAVAVVAGALLALDPAFFFISVLDWGSAVPSFLCRFAAFGLVSLWWSSGGYGAAFFAGLFGGLGFFNKIDFAIVLAGVGAAGVCCWARPLWERRRALLPSLLAGVAGLLLAAGSMFLHLPGIWRRVGSTASVSSSEGLEKLRTLLSMHDGSHFYRLMEAGGRFHEMHDGDAAVWTPFGIAVVLSAACLAARLFRHPCATSRRVHTFLLAAAMLTTLGVFVLPGAVRIHHAILLYPFPHLIVAAAAVEIWRGSGGGGLPRRGIRGRWPLRSLFCL